MIYIVSTPIGNLEDITLRALEVLKKVDLIAAEDTRQTRKLLKRYDIEKPLTSFFEHNEIVKTQYLINKLKEGKEVALVSDAGTPGISDPGYRIIRACIENNIPLTHIPGPCALITGLVLSGAPTDEFTFCGYLSKKGGKRKKELARLKEEQRTIVLYESCYRIAKLLADIIEIWGDIDIIAARELTKMYEETRREKSADLLEYYQQHKARGEFVIVIPKQSAEKLLNNNDLNRKNRE